MDAVNAVPCEDYSVPSSEEKLYIAGPMRGIPFFNFPLFNDVARQLRARGHQVFNPAERDTQRHNGADITNAAGCEKTAQQEHGFNLRDALFDDMAFITKEATGIVTLPGWDKSKGACAEVHTALALGLPVYTVAQALSRE